MLTAYGILCYLTISVVLSVLVATSLKWKTAWRSRPNRYDRAILIWLALAIGLCWPATLPASCFAGKE